MTDSLELKSGNNRQLPDEIIHLLGWRQGTIKRYLFFFVTVQGMWKLKCPPSSNLEHPFSCLLNRAQLEVFCGSLSERRGHQGDTPVCTIILQSNTELNIHVNLYSLIFFLTVCSVLYCMAK